MLPISDFLKRMLPNGTSPPIEGGDKTWSACPLWPPDLFAVTANLIDRSGCYAHPKYSGDPLGVIIHTPNYVEKIQRLAKNWNNHLVTTKQDQHSSDLKSNNETLEIAEAWMRLIGDESLIQPIRETQQPPGWCDDANFLMAVADEASAGIGFFYNDDNSNTLSSPCIEYWFKQYLIKDIILFLRKICELLEYQIQYENKNDLISSLENIFQNDDYNYIDLVEDPPKLLAALEDVIELPYLANSVCQLVPSSEICVQPKTHISAVGCTIRSLSHHLALLPPISQVETFWRVPQNFDVRSFDGPCSINLLLIPFPYFITANCFKQSTACIGSSPNTWDTVEGNRARFFELDQRWLKVDSENSRDITADEISEFICSLVAKSKNEVDQIHGIILPELALNSKIASNLSVILQAKVPGIEFFISGISSSDNQNRGPKNSVHTTVYSEKGYRTWEQAKHHRWKLNRYQIARYHLGASLNPHFEWWEGIDLSPRECYFGVFRHEACLTALVCEDLARLDPVQSVIRSVAPNLCVCLLMDGPQLESRWPGRYATVLADDPGCAVLTFTSLGLLKRTYEYDNKGKFNIALWKESGGERATELSIPTDHHAMVLTLSHKTETAYTLDGRPDAKTVTLFRSAAQPIKLDGELPKWMQP